MRFIARFWVEPSTQLWQRITCPLRCAILFGALQQPTLAAADGSGPLHLPSPDWRDQIIYFVMIDRFADGEPGNNDQGSGEYDPADGARFSGGDLRGLRGQLDYIEELGATALWITPPVANRWWSPQSNYGGYHGYWAENFKAIDVHFGDLADYQALSRDLHGRDMRLIQDIVVNHTGNWFGYPRGWDAQAPAHGFVRHVDAHGRSAPTQPPFDRNDARDPAQRAQAIYHWTPEIVDFRDPVQERDWQLADLDDLNTENPEVRRALRDSYGYWIREAGVDGFRVDTAFYVPPDYFRDFLYADDPAAPGVLAVARASGREDFLLFGEGFGIDRPGEEAQSRRIAAYLHDDAGPLLPSMIDFPLYGSLNDVFARGRPPCELADRIDSIMRIFPDPWRMPSFVDNHDVDRFLAGGSEAALRQALLLIMTLPGIPTIYYGTEQGFREQRAAMFAGGYAAGGRDHFDRQAPLYTYLREAITLRRQHPLFSRGRPTLLDSATAGPGLLAYRMDAAGESALVLFNSAEHAVLVDHLATGYPAGSQLLPRFGSPQEQRLDGAGRLTLALPARAAQVWIPAGTGSPAGAPADAIELQPIRPERQHGDFAVHGRLPPGAGPARLVIDGDLDHAQALPTDARGHFSATVDTRAMVDPGVEHRAVAWIGSQQAVSPARRFRVARRWTVLHAAKDAIDDDHGPAGRYLRPTDPGWAAPSPLDLRGIEVAASGGNLRIDLRVGRLSAVWNPPNGFDHVALTLYLELPGRAGGERRMPLQNAELPEDMRWHYRLRVGGWSNLLSASEGADAVREGRALSPGASIEVDRERQAITLLLPLAALGETGALSGARLFVTSWDYDAGYRALQPAPAAYQFGGGDGQRDPLWMDAIGPIRLP